MLLKLVQNVCWNLYVAKSLGAETYYTLVTLWTLSHCCYNVNHIPELLIQTLAFLYSKVDFSALSLFFFFFFPFSFFFFKTTTKMLLVYLPKPLCWFLLVHFKASPYPSSGSFLYLMNTFEIILKFTLQSWILNPLYTGPSSLYWLIMMMYVVNLADN